MKRIGRITLFYLGGLFLFVILAVLYYFLMYRVALLVRDPPTTSILHTYLVYKTKLIGPNINISTVAGAINGKNSTPTQLRIRSRESLSITNLSINDGNCEFYYHSLFTWYQIRLDNPNYPFPIHLNKGDAETLKTTCDWVADVMLTTPDGTWRYRF